MTHGGVRQVGANVVLQEAEAWAQLMTPVFPSACVLSSSPPPSCVPQGPGVEERQVVVVGVGHQEEGPGERNRHPPTMALVAGVVEGHLRHKKMAEAVVHLLVLLHPPSHGSARTCTGAR